MIAERLINWHHTIDRDMPWKDTNDPYKIWLSEVILQQTRVEQGMPYYLAFVETFPTVITLADAELEEVLKLWQGLGYYSRARNLHAAAQHIRDHYEGVFPKEYKDIISLKGVSPYTAAAIASFAYHQPLAVVDGNVQRVISRIAGIYDPIDQSSGKKIIQTIAQEWLDPSRPAIYNQAIMDFGALICTPKKPKCLSCPFVLDCIACKNQDIDKLPIKSNRIKKMDLYIHYVLLKNGHEIVLQKRSQKGIWQGLYEPIKLSSESSEVLEKDQVIKDLKLDKEHIVRLDRSEMFTHILTHRRLKVWFYLIEVKRIPSEYQSIKLNDVKKLPVPKLIESVLISNGII